MAGLIVGTVLLCVLLVPLAAVTVKRLQDRDRTWRTVVLVAIVLLAMVMIERGLHYWSDGKILFDDSNLWRSVMLLTVAPFSVACLHLTAPISAWVSYKNAVEVLKFLDTGVFERDHFVVLLQSLIGLGCLIIGLWYFWEIGVRRGTVGPNRFGPDPLG